jgi:hypothetical protein
MTRTRRAAAFGGFAATRQDSGIAKRSLSSPAPPEKTNSHQTKMAGSNEAAYLHINLLVSAARRGA